MSLVFSLKLLLVIYLSKDPSLSSKEYEIIFISPDFHLVYSPLDSNINWFLKDSKQLNLK